MKITTCCFSGHRHLPRNKIEKIIKNLNMEIEKLISQGVTNFISGGCFGFDLMAASLIVAKKQMGASIRLVFTLPCRNQEKFWTQEQQALYHGLLDVADEVHYISEEYDSDCMKRRNQYMVDCSAHCICALLNTISGTGQTVRFARKSGLNVVNVAER